MATEQVLHMNGGVGETSYANNSILQRNLMTKVKPILEESITRIYRNILPNCFKVADLGCSSGPNTLLAASEIMNIIDALSYSPSFQIFLNDLPGNDFNTIFKSFPEFYKKLQKEKGEKFGPCFIVGMPGTFHGRLFPSNSMHFFHSLYALHWLSQVPRGLNNGVVPLNKGNIFITKTSPPAVLKAYLKQFQEDFKLFLSCRSEELVQGGGMVLTFIGRLENDEDELITTWSLIGMALNDMVIENKIEEAKVGSFDVPYYAPTPHEVIEIIEAEGSFTLQRLEICKLGWDADIDESDINNIVFDKDMKAKFIAKYMRAVAEPLLKLQFGDDIMDELFQRFANKVAQLIEVKKMEYNNLVLSMTKNARKLKMVS